MVGKQRTASSLLYCVDRTPETPAMKTFSSRDPSLQSLSSSLPPCLSLSLSLCFDQTTCEATHLRTDWTTLCRSWYFAYDYCRSNHAKARARRTSRTGGAHELPACLLYFVERRTQLDRSHNPHRTEHPSRCAMDCARCSQHGAYGYTPCFVCGVFSPLEVWVHGPDCCSFRQHRTRHHDDTGRKD